MDFAIPIAVAVLAWWTSTIAVMYRAGLPRGTFVATLVGATVVMLGGAAAFWWSRGNTSAVGVYAAFMSALAIWAWHEVSYLFGFVTGPQPEACPEGVSNWRRFVLGVRACIYHELAIIATAALLALASWNATNKVALWTFCIFWLMRWSVKLNIFLGVRNLHAEYWPEHLAYLKSFVRHRRMNELFPFSMSMALLGFAGLVATAGGADEPATQLGATLLATLLGLAIIEHGLLVVNIDDGVLWRLGLRSRRSRGAAAR
ncbi:MAG: putative photosynthetic complex assembly protein PuhE [Pseudomonadota bacterium]